MTLISQARCNAFWWEIFDVTFTHDFRIICQIQTTMTSFHRNKWAQTKKTDSTWLGKICYLQSPKSKCSPTFSKVLLFSMAFVMPISTLLPRNWACWLLALISSRHWCTLAAWKKSWKKYLGKDFTWFCKHKVLCEKKYTTVELNISVTIKLLKVPA